MWRLMDAQRRICATGLPVSGSEGSGEQQVAEQERLALQQAAGAPGQTQLTQFFHAPTETDEPMQS